MRLAKTKYNAWHLGEFGFYIDFFTCSCETSIGSWKSIQITHSEHGGVVNDPW